MRSPRTWSTCATPASSPSSCTAAGRRSRRCSNVSASRASSGAATASPRPRRWTSCAWCCPGQVNRELVSLINEHGPLASGLSGEDAGLFTGRRRGAVVDGVEVDLGLVGDVVAVDPAAVHAHLDAGRIPVISLDRARRRHARAVAQRERRLGGGVARSRARRGEARDPHRRRRPLPRLAEPRLARLGHRRARPHRAPAVARVGHDPEDAGVPRSRRGRRREGGDHRRAGAALDPRSRSSPSRASAPRWCPVPPASRPRGVSHERLAAALRRAHHALDRHAAREARARRGRSGVG